MLVLGVAVSPPNQVLRYLPSFTLKGSIQLACNYCAGAMSLGMPRDGDFGAWYIQHRFQYPAVFLNISQRTQNTSKIRAKQARNRRKMRAKKLQNTCKIAAI